MSEKIDWELYEKLFSSLYCQDNGRSGKPIRLMVGLFILKHIRNLSDESVVEQWIDGSRAKAFISGYYFQNPLKAFCQ